MIFSYVAQRKIVFSTNFSCRLFFFFINLLCLSLFILDESTISIWNVRLPTEHTGHDLITVPIVESEITMFKSWICGKKS